MNFGEILDGLRADGDARVVHVPADWAQGRTMFGGLQVALAVRGIRDALEATRGVPLRSLHATFIGPVAAGAEVRLLPRLLRQGRSAAHAHCDLYSGTELGCMVTAIFGAPRPSTVSIEARKADSSADPEALADAPRVPGIHPAFLRHVEMRWAQGKPPYTGHDEPSSLIYARMRDRGCTAEETLIALADSIPTPALSMVAAPAVANSLNWMFEILGDPERLDRDGWCPIATEVRAGCDGYLSQTSILWGPDGHAYSVSHQTVGIYA
jgi:acyl-CoA thioesterase